MFRQRNTICYAMLILRCYAIDHKILNHLYLFIGKHRLRHPTSFTVQADAKIKINIFSECVEKKYYIIRRKYFRLEVQTMRSKRDERKYLYGL